MQISEHYGGTKVLHDTDNLKLIVDDRRLGIFEIVGFECVGDMEDLAESGKFDVPSDNDCLCTKLKLRWNFFDC